MKRFISFLTKRPIVVMVTVFVIALLALFLMPLSKINYDMRAYIPKDAAMQESLRAMEAEFGLFGQADLVLFDVSVDEVLLLKGNMALIEGVETIVWLDTFIEQEELIMLNQEALALGIDLATLDIPGLNQFYKNGNALLQVLFTQSDQHPLTYQAIENLRSYLTIIRADYAMAGSAVNTYFTQSLTQQETYRSTLLVIPIILLVLFLFTLSYIEPIVYLVVVGLAILINVGTNFLFPSVSFLTQSTALLLQLAISMDYAIFLSHSYSSFKESYPNQEAMQKAIKHSFIPIAASMMTTLVSFVALMFMRYGIGLDLARVMIKGIVISFILTLTLLPALLLVCDPWLKKSSHPPFLPKLPKTLSKVFQLKLVFIGFALLVTIPTYQAQRNNAFLYGDAAISGSAGSAPYEEKKAIENVFGKSNPFVILIPVNSTQEEAFLTYLESELTLAQIGYSTQSYNRLVDIDTYLGQMPQALRDYIASLVPENVMVDQLPESMKNQLIGPNYARIILSVSTDIESSEAFEVVEILNQTIPRFYPVKNQSHVIGQTQAVYEIRTMVENDFMFVTLLSIGLVGLVLVISLKKIIVPLVLLFCIQLSVWINMAIPYYTGQTIIFIGYLIVGAIQLGATIDYGILLSHHYLGVRTHASKEVAFKTALSRSTPSILTSVFLLAGSGFALRFSSSIEGIAALGELIGRGALLSGASVLFLLPALLYILDGFIHKADHETG